MTKLPKAPRPCTLWGSTFDANDVTSYGVRAIDDHEAYPASRLYQARITLGDESRVFAVKQHEIRYDAHLDMQDAVNVVNQALHPLLCRKHALEIGYESKVDDVFMALHQFSRKPEWPEDEVEFLSEIKIVKWFKIKRNPDHYQWFYPVNEYGQPNHGEAESYVKVWEDER